MLKFHHLQKLLGGLLGYLVLPKKEIILFREGTINDKEDLILFCKTLYPKDDFRQYADPLTNIMDEIFVPGSYKVVIATKVNGEIVGCCRIIHFSTYGLFDLLRVHPQYRRKKIAQKLFEIGYKIGRRYYGLNKIRLVVASNYLPMNSFSEKNNFKRSFSWLMFGSENKTNILEDKYDLKSEVELLTDAREILQRLEHIPSFIRGGKMVPFDFVWAEISAPLLINWVDNIGVFSLKKNKESLCFAYSRPSFLFFGRPLLEIVLFSDHPVSVDIFLRYFRYNFPSFVIKTYTPKDLSTMEIFLRNDFHLIPDFLYSSNEENKGEFTMFVYEYSFQNS